MKTHRRHPRSYLAPLLSVWMLAGYASPSNAPAADEPKEDREAADEKRLQPVLMQYQRESASVKNEDKAKFFRFWEAQLGQALSATQGGRRIRLRLLDELGALQRSLGLQSKSLETYRQMEAYAERINDAESLMIASDNELAQSSDMKIEDFDRVIAKLESSSEHLVNQNEDASIRIRFSDALVKIGVKLEERSGVVDDVTLKKKLMERAVKAFERSVAFGDDGTTPVATRMYRIARLQSQLGEHAKAAEIYGKLAGMNQTVLSKLWMSALQIQESTAKHSPEYREAIERVLADFEKSGAVDDYYVTLRHELGLSYRIAKEYEKSSAILGSLVGKSGDADFNSYNLFLVALNTKDLGEYEAARELLGEVVKKYPKSGGAYMATNEVAILVDPKASQRVVDARRWSGNISGMRFWLLLANAVALSIAIAFIVLRLKRPAGEPGSDSDKVR